MVFYVKGLNKTKMQPFQKKCEICGTQKARLVRDHNHKTGELRGILCEYCNSRLGSYEYVKSMNYVFRKPIMKFWIKKYGESVEAYLSKPSLGIVWYKYSIDCLCSQSFMQSENQEKWNLKQEKLGD